MPIEIERKFLVVSDSWRARGMPPGRRFCQGYLAGGDGVTVRVRRAGDEAFITIKGDAIGPARPEYEYPIPVGEAEELLSRLCRGPLIEKTRHEVRHGGHVWEIDVFGGANAGLVLAEVELADPQERFVLPPWVGAEVTFDSRYRNSALATAPVGAAWAGRAAPTPLAGA
jgi:CYTH domain-containing protein